MIIPNKHSGYTRDGVRRMYMGGGGDSAPTTTTVNQSNIPEYLRPQVETLLGGATKELFRTKEIPGVDGAPSTFEVVGTKPFTPYSANVKDYVAGFSPLQQQVQYNAANLQVPGQFNQATGYANAAAQGGLILLDVLTATAIKGFSPARWANNWVFKAATTTAIWVRVMVNKVLVTVNKPHV